MVDLLVDTKTELLELALRSGLKVFTTMLEEDRSAICGPRYTREADWPASRAGTTRGEVVLGGRKLAIASPDRLHVGIVADLPVVRHDRRA